MFYSNSNGAPKELLVFLKGAGFSSGTIITSGYVSGIWSKDNSPYIINGDIEIADRAKLIIKPGVDIIFYGRFRFIVGENAQLIAEGTKSDSITFTANNPTEGWLGIRLIESGNDDTLKYCRFEYGKGIRPSIVYPDDQNGGAIYIRGSSPNIENCSFFKNYAPMAGGAIYLSFGELKIDSCYFEENKSNFFGAAIHIAPTSSASKAWITNCIFKSNHSGAGTVHFQGFSEESDLKIYNSKFVNNFGVAIVLKNGRSYLVNSLFTGHSGGAIYSEKNQELQIANCTFTRNSGGGLYSYSPNLLKVINSIFWNNSSDELTFVHPKQNPIIQYCNIQGGYSGIGNINVVPLFIDEIDFKLQNASPCKNSGINSRFFDDFDGSRNDMGMYGGTGLFTTQLDFDFGNTGINNNYPKRVIDWEVFNFRGTDFIINNIHFKSPTFSVVNNQLPVTVQTITLDTISIAFSPDDIGNYIDTMFVQTNDLPSSNLVSFPVLGKGVQESTLEGIISGVLTKDNSPYFVSNNLRILPNDSLIIGEGVVLKFSPNTEFFIEGYLEINGTKEQSILFTCSNDSSFWGNLKFGTKVYTTGKGYKVNANYLIVEKCRTMVLNFSTVSENKFSNCIFRNMEDYSAFSTSSAFGTFYIMPSAGGKEILFKNCSFYNNKGKYIFYTLVSNIKFQNCLIANNYVDNRIGVIYSGRSQISFENSTVINNIAKQNVGGLYIVSNSSNDYSEITINNSIFYNNLPSQIKCFENNPLFPGGILKISYSNIQNGQSGIEGKNDLKNFKWLQGNIDLDPIFSDLLGHLSEVSPCVDAGNPDTTGFYLPLTDLDGRQRIWNGRVDMGCYEYGAPFDNQVPIITELPGSLTFLNRSSASVNVWNYVEDAETPDSLLVFEFETDNDSLKTSFSDMTGLLTLTAPDFIGFANLYLSVTDLQNATASDSIAVHVIRVNTPPRFVGLPDSIVIEQASTENIQIWNYVEDAETPDSLLTYEFYTDYDSLFLDFNEKEGELILLAPSFTGAAMLYLKVTDEANVTVEDSILVLIDTITSVENSLLGIPEDFVLYQNHPNPFNPTTKIPFGMPEAGEVTIQVYNILGQKVMTLLDEKKQAGYHEVVFDSRNLGSGIYIYVMKTESFRRVRKMLLVK